MLKTYLRLVSVKVYYLQEAQNARVTTLSVLHVYFSYVFKFVHLLGQ
jgi:hypothetical protein